MERIFAGIVSFNPDVNRLKENIEAISQQVEKVVIFENGSNEQQVIIDVFKEVKFLACPKNIGIAGALNRLLEWGEKNGYQWMISLDQDSVCSENYVEKMRQYLGVEENLGIVAPVIVDRNVGVVGHNPKKSWVEVRTCITSGAFNNIEAWEKVDGYDESMFIDSVDFEFCYRLRKYGYKVIQVRGVQLEHELGESRKRRFLFWNVNVNGHNAFRKYYIAKNNVYYPLKHHLWLHFIKGNFRNLWLLVVVIIYEDNKKKKISSIWKGWRDGMIIRNRRKLN